jgi:nucleotide-binding universal stress UspA family protein
MTSSTSIRSILHPTDFSDLSGVALAHALRIALVAKSKLELLHIVQNDTGGVLAFPHVRRLLVQWGFSEETDSPSAVSTNLGLQVSDTAVKWKDPTQGIVSALNQRSSDLVVLATHGRDGVERWLHGSVAEAVFRQIAIPALFIAQGSRGFVSQVNGDIRLRRILVPIDFSPEPSEPVEIIRNFARLLTDADIIVHLLHVGSSPPPLHTASRNVSPLPPVILRSGNVVQRIVDTAIEFDVDFIGMPTAGHHGVLDALRGSTTERVIRHAPCPVFTVPIP